MTGPHRDDFESLRINLERERDEWKHRAEHLGEVVAELEAKVRKLQVPWNKTSGFRLILHLVPAIMVIAGLLTAVGAFCVHRGYGETFTMGFTSMAGALAIGLGAIIVKKLLRQGQPEDLRPHTPTIGKRKGR